MEVSMENLSILHRFFFYGLHGFFDEICFTALHDFVFHIPDVSLKGYTSLWAFFIYGSCSLFVEWLYLTHLKEKYHIAIRGLIYIVVAYMWEFLTGLMLQQVKACPWDYSHKPYNIMGIITLEYAPVWLMAGLYQEVLTNFLTNVKLARSTDSSTRTPANQYKTE